MINAGFIFECISGIDDAFIHEAEIADAATLRAVRRKKIVKYGAAGAGLAVAVGIAVAYFRRGGSKAA